MSARNAKKPAAKLASVAAAPMDGDVAAISETAETKKKRHLMTETLTIDISNARCQSHMKAALTHTKTETLLAEKRAALKAAKAAAKAAGRAIPKDADVASIKKELNSITSGLVRIGGDAPIIIASLCDLVVKSAMRYAIGQTLAAKHTMVEISALFSGDPTILDMWPLICDLPSITSYDPKYEIELKAQRAMKNKNLKASREAAKKSREAGAAAENVKKAAPDDDDDDDDDDEDRRIVPTTTFHTYVASATKTVKKEEAFPLLRVSNRLREVLSQAVAELVARFTVVAKVAVLELLGVRTLNASHIKTLIKIIFVKQTGVEDSPAMVEILAYVSKKVASYHTHLEDEKIRKWGEMDPAKQKEILDKQAAVAEAKKKRNIIHAKAKAIFMDLKNKLTAETSGGDTAAAAAFVDAFDAVAAASDCANNTTVAEDVIDPDAEDVIDPDADTDTDADTDADTDV